MDSLKIISDYTDFYDYKQDINSIYIYRRYRSDSRQRGSALKLLRSLGMETLVLKPVTYFYPGDTLVVYTNPNLHSGKGKKVMTFEQAMKSHSNCVATLLNTDTDMSIKYIKVGTRSFKVEFNRLNKNTLDYKISNIYELEDRHFNNLNNLPIYSIDYILGKSNSLIATDFNEVEDLGRYNLDSMISAEEVIDEILKILYI